MASPSKDQKEQVWSQSQNHLVDDDDEGGGTAEEIFRKLAAAEEAKKDRLVYRCWNSHLDPTQQPRKGWDVFMIALVLYSGFMVPYKAVFARMPEEAPEQDTEDWIIDALFYLDIVANFWTGYDNGYKIESDKVEIAKNYVYGFFWVCPPISPVSPACLSTPRRRCGAVRDLISDDSVCARRLT